MPEVLGCVPYAARMYLQTANIVPSRVTMRSDAVTAAAWIRYKSSA